MYSMTGTTFAQNNRSFLRVDGDWVLASDEESDILYEIRAKVRKYREPVVGNPVESTATHGIKAIGGRRLDSPGANDRICTKANLPATGEDNTAITIRFSPTISTP